MKKYRSNKGLKKRCDCARRTWETCSHPWFFNFTWKGQPARGSLEVSSREEAIKKLDEIKVAVRNGTYVSPSTRKAVQPAVASRATTFSMVADHYAKDPEGLSKLAPSSQRQHRYAVGFLAGVIVPPGLPFTDKPFSEIIRADVKLALAAKEQPTERTYRRAERTWTRTIGGKTAANRLHDHLRALWNWAIEERYATTSPFLRTRKGKNRLKHDELSRNRRLREGEEAALLEHASPHLRDVIVTGLATAMRIGEILSLQWKNVRFLQNEIHLPGGKTKSKRDRIVPISIKPELREILTRRQHGMKDGPDGPRPFKFGPDDYVFGDEAGCQIKTVKTAWAATVLRAHGAEPERTRRGGSLTAECRQRLAEIDLNVHDLRHECASRLYFDQGWTIYDVSILLGHANVKTTERYLGVEDQRQRLHELVARQPLALVKG